MDPLSMRWRFNCISCSYFFDFLPIQPCDGFLIAGTATISRFWTFWLGIVARNTVIDLELKFCTPQFRNQSAYGRHPFIVLGEAELLEQIKCIYCYLLHQIVQVRHKKSVHQLCMAEGRSFCAIGTS
jgi:hypothetical protein